MSFHVTLGEGKGTTKVKVHVPGCLQSQVEMAVSVNLVSCCGCPYSKSPMISGQYLEPLIFGNSAVVY